MKRKLRKLTLARETLHDLAADGLGAVAGGATTPRTCLVGCTDDTRPCTLCDTCRPCVA